MQTQKLVVSTLMLAAILPLAPLHASAGEGVPPFRLAMMDMMPMGGASAQSPPAAGAMPGMPAPAAPAQAPMARRQMGDDRMPMGAAAPPAAPAGQTPAPVAAAPSMPGMPAPAAPAPATMPPGRMDDDRMPMGAAAPPAAPTGQPAAPMAAAPAAAMPMCPMCATMMQGMMGGRAAPMGAMLAAPATAAALVPPTPASSAALLETRATEMRTALQITAAQVPVWDVFVASLRTGRQHLELARADLQGSAAGPDPMLRLVSYENHLTARAEAIRITRLAFTTLLGQLNDEQKRIATTTMLPFIGAF